MDCKLLYTFADIKTAVCYNSRMTEIQPIIGYHYALGGEKGEIGQFLARVNQSGQFVCFKGADDASLVFDGIQSGNLHGVSNSLAWRKVGYDDRGNKWELPDYTLSPYDAALLQWQRIKPFIPPELDKSKFWVEHINEPRQANSPDDVPMWGDLDPVEWVFNYCLQMALIMNAEGYRALGPAYATGNPPIPSLEQPGVIEYMRYCAEHPDMAAISVHEYNNHWEDGITAVQKYPYDYGRFEKLIAVADLAGIPRTYKIKVTEWGWGAYTAPSVDQMMADIDFYQHIVTQFWPVVDHVAIWTLQTGWKDIDKDVVKLVGSDGGNPLADYVINTRYQVPVPYARTHPDFGGTVPGDGQMRDEGKAREAYNREYWVADPGRLSAAEKAIIYKKAGELSKTVGPSYDDSGIGSGLKSKTAVLFNIPENERQTFIDWFATWYPSTTVEFRWHTDLIDPPTPPDPPTEALDVISYNQYDSRWGSSLCGTGPRTLAQWGCLLTAYTDLADYYQISNGRNPLEENAYYVQHGGFSGDILVSMAMSKVYPEIKDEKWMTWANNGQAMHVKARQWLDLGRPVPARVDFDPATPQYEQHWVLLTGYNKDTGDYYMNNPWGGKKNVSVDAAYGKPGSPSTVLECIFYYLDENTPTPQPTAVGLHASADGGDGVGYPEPVISEFKALEPSVVKFMSSHSQNMVNGVVTAVKSTCRTWIVRAFQSWGNRALSAQNFYDGTYNDVLRAVNVLRGHSVPDASILIELHNEPNLRSEGLDYSWADGHGCVSFFYEVLLKYKQTLPDLKYGIGGLSPGWGSSFRDESINFMDSMLTHPQWKAFDVVFAHVYTVGGWNGQYELEWIDHIHVMTSKPVWITESSYHPPTDPATGKPKVIPGDQYAAELNKLVNALDKRPTMGVTWYAVSASAEDYRHEAFCISTDPKRPYENVNSRGISVALNSLRASELQTG